MDFKGGLKRGTFKGSSKETSARGTSSLIQERDVPFFFCFCFDLLKIHKTNDGRETV